MMNYAQRPLLLLLSNLHLHTNSTRVHITRPAYETSVLCRRYSSVNIGLSTPLCKTNLSKKISYEISATDATVLDHWIIQSKYCKTTAMELITVLEYSIAL
jgi:hypothetical protein